MHAGFPMAASVEAQFSTLHKSKSPTSAYQMHADPSSPVSTGALTGAVQRPVLHAALHAAGTPFADARAHSNGVPSNALPSDAESSAGVTIAAAGRDRGCRPQRWGWEQQECKVRVQRFLQPRQCGGGSGAAASGVGVRSAGDQTGEGEQSLLARRSTSVLFDGYDGEPFSPSNS